MVRALTVIAMAGILFWAMPAQAEMAVMVDSDLDSISGKGHVLAGLKHAPNTYELLNSTVTTQTATGNANTQIGWFQWADDHVTDASDHKGANDQSGEISVVQQNVTAELNAISWGAYAGTTQVAGDIGGGVAAQTSLTRSSLRIGGF